MNRYLIVFITGLCLVSITGLVHTQSGLPVPTDVGTQAGTFSALVTPDLTTGAWVKYQIKRVQEGSAGFKTIWTSDIKMTVTGLSRNGTGRDQEPGNKFWLELVINENEDYQKVFRFLVDEAGQPLPEKLVIKRGKLNAVEMDLALWSLKTDIPAEELLKEAIGHFWRIPFPYVLKQTKAVARDKVNLVIKGQNETFTCQRYISNQVLADAGAKVWLTNQVPLAGVAKMLLIEEGYQTLFRLVGSGTNGRSIIKERPTQLGFKEKK